MVLAAFIVFFAAFVRAVSGFGYSLIATPLLTFVIEPKSVVVINVILAGLANALVLFHMRRHVDLRRLAFISIGSIFGVALGAYLLSSLDASIIKLAIAVVVIPFSVLLLLGHAHQFKREAFSCGVAGFLGGTFGASTSLSGPPVVLFLLNQGLVKERFIGTLAAYLLLNCVVSTSAFASLGMVTVDLLTTVAILLPALGLGSYVGLKVLPKIDAVLFKKIALSIVSVTALVIIMSVLMGW